MSDTPQHTADCVRKTFGEFGREQAEVFGCDDPKLPEHIAFWVCHPWCPVLLSSLARAHDIAEEALS